MTTTYVPVFTLLPAEAVLLKDGAPDRSEWTGGHFRDESTAVTVGEDYAVRHGLLFLGVYPVEAPEVPALIESFTFPAILAFEQAGL